MSKRPLVAKMNGYTQNTVVLGRREVTVEVMDDTAGGRQTAAVLDHGDP